MSTPVNVVYVNNTRSDFGCFFKEISKALQETGRMPEELADMFVAVRSPVDNPDGTPRYIINMA